MLQYPSIPHFNKVKDSNNIYYFFGKDDGSNFRAEFNSKKGFYKFGTRNETIDTSAPIFGEAIHILKNDWEEKLTKVFKSSKIEGATCFFEFLGTNSFAGAHDPNEKHKLIMFDIHIYKKGFMSPESFIEKFSEFDISNCLYIGKLTQEVFDSIVNSTIENMPIEGIVAKRFDNRTKSLEMFKIKSSRWLDKLREKCGDNKAMFEKLK